MSVLEIILATSAARLGSLPPAAAACRRLPPPPLTRSALHRLSPPGLLSLTQLEGQQRVELLRTLEQLTGDAFQSSLATEPTAVAAVAALGGGPAAEQRLHQAALHQQLTGIPEYNPAFFAVLESCAHRQQMQR